MIRVALCSAKGSPGVTTFACALAAVMPSERPVVVAECDPSGGDIAARFGITSRQGMSSWILSSRHRSEYGALDGHVQNLAGGLGVIVGPTSSESATALDKELAAVVSDMHHSELTFIADCGRLVVNQPGQAEVLRAASTVLLVSAADVASLSHARWAAEVLSRLRPEGEIGLIVSRFGVERAGEAASVVGLPLVGVVRSDARAASLIGGVPGTTRTLDRSNLIGSARAVAARLQENWSSEAEHEEVFRANEVGITSESSVSRPS